MTPQEIREAIKREYPQFYGTQAQIRNVEAGHYKDIDHALLADIYTRVGTNKQFLCDRGSKPMRISLLRGENAHLRERQKAAYSGKGRPSVTRSGKWEQEITDILVNFEKYHEAYYEAETFRGPSLYFHQRALESRRLPVSLTHLEYVYATLASWGMHRMGKGGSKMQSFDAFRRSVESLSDRLADAQTFDFREMNDRKWAALEEIFLSLTVMASGTSLVGNSKVMHHIMPNIVPPIDREYTLWYLLGNKSIKNDLGGEWELMKNIISGFFIPIVSNPDFEATAMRWLAKSDQYPWDTSPMKIVDNLLIGSKKLKLIT